VTPEEALGRLSAEDDGLDEQLAADLATIRKALADLAWYRREYPIAHRIATQTRAQVADLRRQWDAHDRRCRWGGRR
jgi:hypothetical protein